MLCEYDTHGRFDVSGFSWFLYPMFIIVDSLLLVIYYRYGMCTMLISPGGIFSVRDIYLHVYQTYNCNNKSYALYEESFPVAGIRAAPFL